MSDWGTLGSEAASSPYVGAGDVAAPNPDGVGVVDVTTLIARCRQGDALAWEALVRAYQGRILGLARHYMRDHEEARDVAQEIFIKLYERLETFQGDARFVPWMLSLARN